MLAYQNGDPTAFEILFKRHRGGLVSYLYQMSKNMMLSEEISQATWMKLIELATDGRYQPDPRAKFRTYLYLIARRKLYDVWDSADVQRRTDLPDEDLLVVVDGNEQHSDPGENLDLKQRLEQLLQALDTLSQEQREVMILRFQGELSWEEIAKITDSTYDTTRSRARYGIKKLRGQLGKSNG